jgi:hypothetical protein
MSKEITYTTEIRLPPSQLVSVDANIKGSPCQEILRLACDKAARDHRGVVSQTYRDNRGQVHHCLLAVETSDFPQGIGLQLQRDGRITFCYDAYAGDKEVAEAICRQIRQTYVTITLLRSLQQVGFDLEASEKDISSLDRVIVISGKKWSGEKVSIVVGKQEEVNIDFTGYPGERCSRDETAVRRALEAQDLRIEVRERKEKREDPLAAWNNTHEVRIRCDE